MPIFDPVARPGGYCLFVHTMPSFPRKSNHPLVNGGAFATQHGYTQEKVIYGRFFQSSEIEAVIAAEEVDGFIRDGDPKVSPDVGKEVGLYQFEVTLRRYTAS